MAGRDRQLRELQDLHRRFDALPIRHQLILFEQLREKLGVNVGRETAVHAEVRARMEMLAALDAARAALSLPEGQAPTKGQYMQVARQIGLPDWNRIRRVWGSFGTAQRALAGGRVPEGRARREIRAKTNGRRRSHELPLHGIRIWLEDPHTRGEGERAYRRFVAAYHDHLGPGEAPIATSAALRYAYPGLNWTELVAAARGTLDPDELVRVRGAERAAAAAATHGFIGTADVAAVLGIAGSAVPYYAGRAGTPTPAARLGKAILWDTGDVRAHAMGNGAPREPFWRQSEILGSADIAKLLGYRQDVVIAYLWSNNPRVPRPCARISGRHCWLREDVEEWLRHPARASAASPRRQ